VVKAEWQLVILYLNKQLVRREMADGSKRAFSNEIKP
jgi:hypothetical protein